MIIRLWQWFIEDGIVGVIAKMIFFVLATPVLPFVVAALIVFWPLTIGIWATRRAVDDMTGWGGDEGLWYVLTIVGGVGSLAAEVVWILYAVVPAVNVVVTRLELL